MKKSNYKRIALVGIILFTLVSLFAKGASESGPIVLRYAENNPVGDSITMAAKELARLVDERSDGRITIEVYHGGQLGGHENVIQSLQVGTLEMGRTQFGYLADAGMRKLAIFSLPFMFSGIEHARATLESPIGQDLLAEIRSTLNLEGLGYLATYPRHFFFRKADVRSLADMKGLRLRVQPGALYVNMVQAFGASATPINFGELYTALQTGVVDGAEQPLKGYVNNQFPEVAKHLTLTAHQIDPSIVLVSPTIWKKLSPADQQLLKTAFIDAQAYYQKVAEKEENAALDKIKAAGVTISEVDHAEWQAAVSSLYDDYSDFADVIKAIQNVSY